MSLQDGEVPFNLDREFSRWVEEETEILDRVINAGSCTDFAHYKHLAGQRQGLQKAKQRLQELIEAWNNRS